MDASTLAAIVACVAAVASAGATIVYTLYTRAIIEETRLMRVASCQPHISILPWKREDRVGWDLIVVNDGLGPAFDVRFTVLKDGRAHSCNISEVGIFKNGLNYFAIGQSIALFVAANRATDVQVLPDPLIIEVSYSNALRSLTTNTFDINWSEYEQLTQVPSRTSSVPVFPTRQIESLTTAIVESNKLMNNALRRR